MLTQSILLTTLILSLTASPQSALFRLKTDGSGFELTEKGASHLASLPLKCIEQEFPNKTSHTSVKDSDHVLLPNQLHPAFYGCFDWHSSVHGHWMLVRLLKQFPNLAEGTKIRAQLDRSLNETTIAGELRYFSLPLTSGWERTYGWGWLLQLDAELASGKDADAMKWHAALAPLSQKIVELWMKFLPKQTYANRTGVHPNTAFGMVLALDYARTVKNEAFETALLQAARGLFAKDVQAPVQWEPAGSDFLSPTLEETDLMQRILPQKEFITWLNKFLPAGALTHLAQIPVVSDRTDLQIVHLDGLCFSRAWCMNHLARVLPATDPRRKQLLDGANKLLAAALPHVVSGEYGGEHWLASFAVYALAD